MPAAPDIDQCRAEGSTQKALVEQRSETKQSRHRVCHHPGEMCCRWCRLFQHAGVSLDEEDVEDELYAKRTEINKSCEQAPILSYALVLLL